MYIVYNSIDIQLLPMIKSLLIKSGIVAIAIAVIPTATLAAPPSLIASDRQDLTSLDTAIGQNPQDLDAYLQRGRLNAKLNRSLMAIADYTEVIRLDPNQAVAYYDRGMVKLNLKDYRGAYLDYSAAIRLRPQQALIYNNRATARYQLGDCKGAIADFKTAAELFRQQGDRDNYLRTLANLQHFQPRR